MEIDASEYEGPRGTVDFPVLMPSKLHFAVYRFEVDIAKQSLKDVAASLYQLPWVETVDMSQGAALSQHFVLVHVRVDQLRPNTLGRAQQLMEQVLEGGAAG